MEKERPFDEKLDLIFLIDRSGSMYNSVEDTIGGFNSFIEKERAKKLDTKVTVVLFDDEYEVLYKRKTIDEVEKLTSDEYYVRGTTALLDAIGKTITSLDREIENKALFVIMTDGKENASIEFSKSQIKNMINNHKWEFLFIGADIDSYSEANGIGIRKSRAAHYKKTKNGVNDLFSSVENASLYMRSDRSLDDGEWKKDLKKYD
ncbi:vWA domain-containing protein [uncultured Methanobrevibacter sp.]|uniref:vWA domain-containing protein n=1 Tax=uncultured Methanobrevibacter sp. TaxID=253161 RepID=UPI0025DCA367|nr:vWA domain-containing protein [uncultured Methanobrevibacter sp.]